jgi:hypothetical protein
VRVEESQNANAILFVQISEACQVTFANAVIVTGVQYVTTSELDLEEQTILKFHQTVYKITDLLLSI